MTAVAVRVARHRALNRLRRLLSEDAVVTPAAAGPSEAVTF